MTIDLIRPVNPVTFSIEAFTSVAPGFKSPKVYELFVKSSPSKNTQPLFFGEGPA